MTKFNKYLNDRIDEVTVNGISFSDETINKFLETWKLITKECRPFLKELKPKSKNYNLMYRGMHFTEGATGRKDIHTDRQPKDTDVRWHEAMDEAFYKEFRVRARSESMFCYGDVGEVLNYGDAFMVFPTGRFSFLYAPRVKDLYARHFGDGGMDLLEPTEDMEKDWEDDWEREYGEGEYGTWSHPSDPYNALDGHQDRDAAAQDFIDEIYNDEYYDDIQTAKSEGDTEKVDELDKEFVEEYANNKKKYAKEMVWEPYMDFDAYRESTWQDFDMDDMPEEAFEKAAMDIVKNEKYRNRSLAAGLKTGAEIMVQADQYYYMSAEMEPLVRNALEGNSPDPRQLQFDFMNTRKKGRR